MRGTGRDHLRSTTPLNQDTCSSSLSVSARPSSSTTS